MEYYAQYLFKEREYAKLAAWCGHPTNVSPVTKRVRDVRGFVRLFIKTWLAAAAVNRVRHRQVRPTRAAGVLVGCALSYRTTFRLINKIVNTAPLGVLPARERALLAPAVSGAIAGYVLSCGLPPQLAGYAAIYLASKVVEWGYNWADDEGKLGWKPRVLGTWILFPLALGQLLQVAFTNPQQCPTGFKRVLAVLSGGSLTPHTDDMLRAVNGAVQAGFPAYRSPLTMASSSAAAALANTSYVQNNPEALMRLMTAHPAIKTAIGALLHPEIPSNFKFFKKNVGANLWLLAKYLLPFYFVKAYVSPKSPAAAAAQDASDQAVKHEPALVAAAAKAAHNDRLQALTGALLSTCRNSIVYSMAFASAISGIEMSRTYLGRSPRQTPVRYRIVGIFSGLWAVVNQRHGRAQYLYAIRLALLSMLPSLGSQKAMAQIVLPIAMAGAFVVLSVHPLAISQRMLRKVGYWMQEGEFRLRRNTRAKDQK